MTKPTAPRIYSPLRGRQLRWPDAAVTLGLAGGGTLAAGAALRAHWIPGIVAAYAAHAWLAALVLAWDFWLGRRFPVGALVWRQLLPWSALWLLAGVLNLVQAFSVPPEAVQLPAPALLPAQLVFLALAVGPTADLLFRGLVETANN